MPYPIGQTVKYISAKGDQKLAFITANTETITEGTDLPTLNPDHYALAVFSPTGAIYPKFGVPDFNGESVNQSEYTVEGEPREVIFAL